MKRIAVLLGLLPALACGKGLTVVTTLSDLAAIVKEVGREHVRVSAIVVGARDPHRIEAKPSFISRAAQADMWVAIGLDLEAAYEGPILQGSGNRRIARGASGHVHVGEWVRRLDVPAGGVSRAQGDIHPYGNPHVWLDPHNCEVIALKLAERMAQLDAAHAADYRANAKAFANRIDVAMFGPELVRKHGASTLWSWSSAHSLESNLRQRGDLDVLGGWAKRMLSWNGDAIVTYHRSWSYFADRFGLRVPVHLEPKPGLDPSPGHLAAVIRTIQAQKARCILQEPFYSRRSADFVAARTGVRVVVAPGSIGHDSKLKSVVDLFEAIVNRLTSVQ